MHEGTRRIILTGASEGIGRALALELAARGARLALAARDRDRLESLAQECRARGGDAVAVPTDVTNRRISSGWSQKPSRRSAASTPWSTTPASRCGAASTRSQDLSIFERVMEVNYLAPVRLTALALPHLQESRGLIVAVASLAGLTGVPERSAMPAANTRWSGSSIRCASNSRGTAST